MAEAGGGGGGGGIMDNRCLESDPAPSYQTNVSSTLRRRESQFHLQDTSIFGIIQFDPPISPF